MKPIKERLSIPELISYAAEYIFERRITDIAGGNISAREGDIIYMSPTLAGNQFHWNIDSNDIVIGSMKDLEKLKKHPKFTREGFSHLAIYEAFPYVGAVIHAHPQYINPFVAKSKPIPPLLNSSKKFGVLQYHEEAESYSIDQAEKIVKVLMNQEEKMKTKAAGVLMPRHGIIVASGDLMTAIDCVERMNNNAFTVLAQKWIE
jgi:L-fuculose-phosphate aldolase